MTKGDPNLNTKPDASAFTSNPTNVKNLVVFTFAMLAVSHAFQLLAFYMKYLPGSIFINAYASSTADSFGYLACMFFATCIPKKKHGFLISYFITAVAALFVAIETHRYEKAKEAIQSKNVDQENSNWTIPAGVLMTKFGCALSFTFIYASYSVYFKSQHMGLVMGIVNFFGKGFTSFSPMVAEMSNPYPMGSVVLLSTIGFILSFLLEKPEGLHLEEKVQEETTDVETEMPTIESVTTDAKEDDDTLYLAFTAVVGGSEMRKAHKD